MSFALTYTDAVPDDSHLLTETSSISKKYWGYSDELMNLWKADLEVSEEYIRKNIVVKVFDQSVFIGFFGLKKSDDKTMEIDHLWLLPHKIKHGYGRLIFQYIINYLTLGGYIKATLVAEPNAKGFYDKMGGKVIGQFQSKVSGRFLDIYEFNLGD